MSDYNGTNHNGTKLDINNKRKTGKLSKTQKLNNTLKQCKIRERITRETRKYFNIKK